MSFLIERQVTMSCGPIGYSIFLFFLQIIVLILVECGIYFSAFKHKTYAQSIKLIFKVILYFFICNFLIFRYSSFFNLGIGLLSF